VHAPSMLELFWNELSSGSLLNLGLVPEFNFLLLVDAVFFLYLFTQNPPNRIGGRHPVLFISFAFGCSILLEQGTSLYSLHRWFGT